MKRAFDFGAVARQPTVHHGAPIDDATNVARSEATLEKPERGSACAVETTRLDVRLIEEEHEHALNLLRRRRRRCREGWASRSGESDPCVGRTDHAIDGRDVARRSVFEHLEVGRRKVADEQASPVANGDVHLDGERARAKRRPLLGYRGSWRLLDVRGRDGPDDHARHGEKQDGGRQMSQSHAIAAPGDARSTTRITRIMKSRLVFLVSLVV